MIIPEKCKDCCSRLFCMSVAEVTGEDFETIANKKDCRKRVFTNATRFRAMSDEEQQKCVRRFWEIEDFADWLKQPAE